MKGAFYYLWTQKNPFCIFRVNYFILIGKIIWGRIKADCIEIASDNLYIKKFEVIWMALAGQTTEEKKNLERESSAEWIMKAFNANVMF